MPLIYVDNNSATRVAPEVFQAMQPYFCELYGNASSVHSFGRRISRAMDAAREQVAELLGCRARELTFTSGGTESINMAIRGILSNTPDKKHIITTVVEHSAVLNLCKALDNEGYQITYLDVDSEGGIDLEELAASITPQTALISIMWANNETGVLCPIEQAGAIARDRGVAFHTDAVQAVGKVPISLKSLPVDLLSLSGHKFHASKGIGALYVRRGIRVRPLIFGGQQERGLRSGTENVPAIIGLGKASQIALRHREVENNRVLTLRDRLEDTILKTIPDVRVNGERRNRLPNTTNLSFDHVEGEAVLLSLNEHGICASSGSACSSHEVEPSHVLLAMGLGEAAARQAVRFSLSKYSSDEDVDTVLRVLPGVVGKLRSMAHSPV